MRRFERSQDSSREFWEIVVASNRISLRYGRIGTNGQCHTTQWTSNEEAHREAEKLIQQILQEGYSECSAPGTTSVNDTTIAAFVNALQAEPDDLVGWQAFADFLTEQDDPRAEFMRVQIALEDESLSRLERQHLAEQELRLLHQYESEFLSGDLSEAIYEVGDFPRPSSDCVFRRGWLWELHNLCLRDSQPQDSESPSTAELLSILAASEGAQFLQELHFQYLQPVMDLGRLTTARFAPALRRLRIGDDEYHSDTASPGLAAFVAACPRLESLFVSAQDVDTVSLFRAKMPNLKEFGFHSSTQYPLDELAANKSLTKLESLHFRPQPPSSGYVEASLNDRQMSRLGRSKNLPSLKRLRFHFWDGGERMAQVLITTGLLFRLELLDLQYGNLTDRGANLLHRALSQHDHQLKSLILDDNFLESEDYLEEAFEELGIEFSADNQHGDGEDYLYSGDIE